MSSLRLLTDIAFDWGIRCFGMAHMKDPRVRALRCVEEAIELAQCCSVNPQQLRDLIDVIYARPVGRLHQELGGTLLTACVLCRSIGADDPLTILELELRRVLDKNSSAFSDRNRDKIAMGFK
jgi:hypothetical protein